MTRQTITALAAALRDGSVTSRSLTEASLARIEAQQEGLNAFITVTADAALAAADVADKALAAGEGGPLTGVPFAHKDIFCTAGVRTTCGSRMLADFVAPYDATVVENLAAAGVVVVGDEERPAAHAPRGIAQRLVDVPAAQPLVEQHDVALGELFEDETLDRVERREGPASQLADHQSHGLGERFVGRD